MFREFYNFSDYEIFDIARTIKNFNRCNCFRGLYDELLNDYAEMSKFLG